MCGLCRKDAIGRSAANQESPLFPRCKLQTTGLGGGGIHTYGQVSDNIQRGRGSKVTVPAKFKGRQPPPESQ